MIFLIINQVYGQAEDYGPDEGRSPGNDGEEKLPADKPSSNDSPSQKPSSSKQPADDRNDQAKSSTVEPESDAPRRTSYTEERFNQWFNPRNRLESRQRFVPKHNVRPKPTLPSFIKSAPNVKPLELNQPAARSTTSRPSTTTRPTSRSNRNRNRDDSRESQRSTSTTVAPRRGFTFATRRSSGGRVFLRDGSAG